MARTKRPFDARAALLTGLALALGLPAVGDPVGLLAWLALLAPALGFVLGRLGTPWWPFGPALLGGFGALLTFADLESARDLPTPLWGLFAVGGPLFLFWAFGARCARRAPERDPYGLVGGGLLLLLALVAAGAPALGGLGRPDATLARDHPALARALLSGSPLTFTLECAGLDWTHSHPEIYRASGVEWFPRHPFPGALAGSVALAIGVAAAGTVRGRRSPGSA